MVGSTCMRLINEISKKEDCRKLWMQNLFTFRQRCSESNNLYHVQTSSHVRQSGKRDFRGQDFIIRPIPMNLLFYKHKSKAFSKSINVALPLNISIILVHRIKSNFQVQFGDKYCSLYKVSLINIYSFRACFLGNYKMRKYKDQELVV